MRLQSPHPRASPPRRVIVVVDDMKEILEFHRRTLTQQFLDRYEYCCFDNDEEATNFVRTNSKTILAYIQDINRIQDITRPETPPAGVAFFNNVIDTLTPWAKCLVVSGTASISHPKALSSFLGYKIRWVIKGRIRSPESLRADLEWLVIPFKTNSEAVSDNETVSMIKLIAPPWKQLCRYIFSHQEYLHTMNPSDFELFAGEIFRSFGWDVEFTSRTRDGGYDVIAIRRAQPSNIRILVEAKRFAPRRTVGVDVIRSLYGVKQSKAASQLVLVTSSFVSLDAKKEFARVVPWELDFFERDKILEWCREQSSVKLSGEFSNLGPNKA